jgi:predicted AlkP superfamily phosphohydrolase/phosphomutase
MTVDSPRRLAVIGLDAAEWSLVEPMMDDGDLPHLAALRGRAAFARLSHDGYRSGLVWEHFLTGRGAIGNGRWSVVRFDPSSYTADKEGARPLTPFFRSVAGRSICFDVPYTSLASTEDAVAITGWGGHDPAYPRASNPPGLLREIEARFGPHPAFDNDYEIIWNRPAALDSLADALVVGARRRADVATWLMRRFRDWRLFVTVLSEPHSAGEQLWHGLTPDYPVNSAVDGDWAGRRLREVYRAVDDAVGRIVTGLPPETTVVAFSMHGTGPNDADVASMVLLPELLHRLALGQSFLPDPDQRSWTRQGFPVIVPGPDQAWHDYMALHHSPTAAPGRRSVRNRVRATLPRPVLAAYRAARTAPAPVTPPPAQRRGALGYPIVEETEASPDQIGVPIDALDWQTTYQYRQAWPRMPAFALPTFYDGRVRINLAGREIDGVVSAGDYENACREVEAAVRACRDPRTGEPVVADIRRLRTEDPWAAGGADADVEIAWSHATDAVTHPQVGCIGPFPFRSTGGHGDAGFAFVAGPEIEPGELGSHNALSLPATVVALLDGDRAGMECEPLPITASR